MVNTPVVALATLGMTVFMGVRAPADEATQERTFSECFLYKDSEGAVWVGHPLVSLGMIGVMANPPLYRLSPPLAERFAPLVNEVAKAPETPRFWWWGLPSPKGASDPLSLVRLEVKAELRKPEVMPKIDPPGNIDGPGSPAIYEITSAKLVCAELISPQWRRAWKSLEAGLEEIVAASRTAPGADKTKRLAAAIERSSRALTVMTSEGVSDRTRALVERIEPQARAVRLFQRSVERGGVGSWGGQLRHHVATLRIAPKTPLPKPIEPCPTIELLADSASAEKLIARIKAKWPEDTLYERLIFSMDLKRTVFVWQVGDLTAEQFQSLRRQAKEELARRREKQPPSGPPTPSDQETTVPEWNVVLRPAGADVLADKGLLRGTVVEKVLGSGSPVGLQTGDLIINYRSVYDLVMGAYGHFSPAAELARTARYGGKLDVLRGDRILTLTGAPSEKR